MRFVKIPADLSTAGSDLANKFREGGDFNNIWQSGLITGSLL